MASVKRLQHGAYTVGWICALHVEMAAAKAMLDERHQNLPQPPRDNNNYVLGEIFGHNVVIACLPSGEYGTNSAATVSTQMLSTFPQIQFNLMVGISGGAPGTVDIRQGNTGMLCNMISGRRLATAAQYIQARSIDRHSVF
jgi:hypothetical protein